MTRQSLRHSLSGWMFVLLLLPLLMPRRALAHAALQKSEPAAQSILHPGTFPILLTYNSRIDASHSSLSLVVAGKAQPLAIDTQAPANVLRSQGPLLPPGHYLLRWQVVATDGHISRGEVPFEVR